MDALPNKEGWDVIANVHNQTRKPFTYCGLDKDVDGTYRTWIETELKDPRSLIPKFLKAGALVTKIAQTAEFGFEVEFRMMNS